MTSSSLLSGVSAIPFGALPTLIVLTTLSVAVSMTSTEGRAVAAYVDGAAVLRYRHAVRSCGNRHRRDDCAGVGIDHADRVVLEEAYVGLGRLSGSGRLIVSWQAASVRKLTLDKAPSHRKPLRICILCVVILSFLLIKPFYIFV